MASSRNDYTELPIGTRIDKGEIVICPYCHRHGLKVFVNDVAFYNHRMGAFLVGEMVQIVDESCPKDPTERAAHEAAQPK
jgi:hypothetical protein